MSGEGQRVSWKRVALGVAAYLGDLVGNAVFVLMGSILGSWFTLDVIDRSGLFW